MDSMPDDIHWLVTDWCEGAPVEWDSRLFWEAGQDSNPTGDDKSTEPAKG